MQIYFHSCLCSYLSRVPILVEGTVYIELYLKYISLHAKFKLKELGYLFLWNIIKGAQTEWKKNKWMSGLVDNKWSF